MLIILRIHLEKYPTEIRLEKDACLNNLKLNLSLTCTSTKDRNQSQTRKGAEQAQNKKHRDKLLKGSLENVSSNPLGEFISQESSLRRCRSLAISREDIFTSLEIPSATRRRRSQLIPRAKLIDKTSSKDRCLQKGRSHENLQTGEYIQKRRASITTEVTTLQQSQHNPQKSQGSITQIRKPELTESPFIHINSFPTRFRSEIDSLDSNYQNKTSVNSVCRVSQAYSDIGLNLPNYYPDSKCDTDASLTDNLSVSEERGSTENLLKQSSGEHRNRDKTENKDTSNQNLDSIPYDENIILSKNTPLYDSLGEYSYCIKPVRKPRTIRGNTPYYRENEKYYTGKPRSLPNYSTTAGTYDSDSTLSDYNINYDPCKSKENDSSRLEYVESDTNFDEIKLSNENIKLIHKDKVTENIIYDSKSESSNVETNPVYDDIINDAHSNEVSKDELKLSFKEVKDTENSPIKHSDLVSKSSKKKRNVQDQPIKTYVKVQAADNIKTNTKEIVTNSDDYKTIVSVDGNAKVVSNDSSKTSTHESKKHSHNYLKEFLESQKGSKGPLQNFLSKKISRAFGDKTAKIPSNKDTNLTDNQYYSLPDISIGKNLRKCDKIDRKLRKCENDKIVNSQQDTTNRFIVNIGRHFDVTAQSNIPIDFELKISKIPKSQKSKHKRSEEKTVEETEKTFLDAVKNLKETLKGTDENLNFTKPEIVAVQTKSGNCEQIKRDDLNNLIIDSFYNTKYDKSQICPNEKSHLNIPSTNKNSKNQFKMSQDDITVDKEYQDKLGTVRNYWDKMINEASEKATTEIKDNENKTKETNYKCKIVDVQTKVDDVKKIFEKVDETGSEMQESKVKKAKQIFETISKNEKNGKAHHSHIKECRDLFENPYFERDNSNQLESLNPNIVEIIEKEEKMTKECLETIQDITQNKTNKNNKKHKPVVKSKSITAEPEFDHVRYRVMKSDVFQKKIFANCEKESQFDGLMQYLQNYSFQELLIDNNIVIIEPIRSNIKYEPRKSKASRNVTQLIHKTNNSTSNSNAGLRRHFFYHPIRVNREVNDEELPNPDTVKQVRQFFEGGLKRSQSSNNLDEITKQTVQYTSVDPDKDRCSTTDTNSSTLSDYGSNENLFESLEELCCENQYVSEDILEKIRERGTSVTYYGGRVLNKHNGKSSSLTKTIMDEIRRNSSKSNDCNCRRNSNGNKYPKSVTFAKDTRKNSGDNNNETYEGIKFKLLKSNSCSSRVELVGTKNLSDYRTKFLNKQKQLINEHNKKTQEQCLENESETDYTEAATINLKKSNSNTSNNNKKRMEAFEGNNNVIFQMDKNSVNESIKQNTRQHDDQTPKIIGEEIKASARKMTQWSDVTDETTYSGIHFSKVPQKISHDYHNFEKDKLIPKKLDDMEFEPYEIAN